MTRRSKREIERALEDLGQSSGSPQTSTADVELRDQYSPDAVTLIYRVVRDFLRVCHHHPDAIVNAPDDEALEVFLEAVREEYELPANRDEAVHRVLMSATNGRPYWPPMDSFGSAVVWVAGHCDVVDEDGTSLQEFVDAGREQDAEKLLVSRTYDLLAGEGGRSVEVTA